MKFQFDLAADFKNINIYLLPQHSPHTEQKNCSKKLSMLQITRLRWCITISAWEDTCLTNNNESTKVEAAVH